MSIHTVRRDIVFVAVVLILERDASDVCSSSRIVSFLCVALSSCHKSYILHISHTQWDVLLLHGPVDSKKQTKVNLQA